VIQEEQDARGRSGVAFVYEDGALAKQMAVRIECQINERFEQRVSWADEGSERRAGQVYQRLVKADALIALWN